MRITKLDISNIQFIYQDYNQDLYDSIIRIGFSFPIKVQSTSQGYICVDGHKRLSVLHDILKEHPDYHRGSQVNVIIENNGDSRSNDCWRGRNSH